MQPAPKAAPASSSVPAVRKAQDVPPKPPPPPPRPPVPQPTPPKPPPPKPPLPPTPPHPQDAAQTITAPNKRLTRTLWAALIVYGITLATIALWPTHIDAPASGLLSAITRAIPWLTYARIEFTANILLFVPFGALATLLIPRIHWWCALGAALAFSTTAELLQMLATDRTSTVQDVVANTLGAAIGILAVALTRAKNGRPQGRPIP